MRERKPLELQSKGFLVKLFFSQGFLNCGPQTNHGHTVHSFTSLSECLPWGRHQATLPQLQLMGMATQFLSLWSLHPGEVERPTKGEREGTECFPVLQGERGAYWGT